MSINLGIGLFLDQPSIGGAVFDYNPIAGGSVPAGLLFNGANGTYFDSTGVLQDASSNSLRFDYNPSTLVPRGILIEPVRTNSLKNNMLVGGVAPSTWPTNWNASNLNGLTLSIVSISTVAGKPVIRVNVTGTPTVAGAITAINMDGLIPASNGQTWTHGLEFAITGGSTTNLPSIYMVNRLRDAGGTNLSSGAALNLQTATATLTRYSLTQTLANPSVGNLQPAINFYSSDNTTPINITFDISLPFSEQGAYATSPIKTSGSAVTRAADLPYTALSNMAAPFYCVIEFELENPTGNAVLSSIHEPASVNIPSQIKINSGNNWVADTLTAGVTQGSLGLSGIPATGTIYRFVHAVATDNLRACINGGTIVSDALATISSFSQLRLGGDRVSGNQSAFWLRRFRIFQGIPTDAQMQAF